MLHVIGSARETSVSTQNRNTVNSRFSKLERVKAPTVIEYKIDKQKMAEKEFKLYKEKQQSRQKSVIKNITDDIKFKQQLHLSKLAFNE